MERMVGLVVALLDATALRIGNEAYARENRTFGLTTLRCRHAEVDGCRLHLSFRGKGGHAIEVTCSDRRLARLVSRCQELPGQLLFQYSTTTSSAPWSSDVNDYLRDATGLDATAKTFRPGRHRSGHVAAGAGAVPESEPAANGAERDRRRGGIDDRQHPGGVAARTSTPA